MSESGTSSDPVRPGRDELLDVEWDQEVLRIRGELDLASAPKLKEAIHACIESRRNQIVIDCSALTFIDASGLSVFRCAQRRFNNYGGGKLILQSPSRQARLLFDLTDMAEVLTIIG